MIKLNGLPLLSFNTSYGDIPEVEWVKQHNLEDQVIFNSSSTRALMNAAQDGLGAAILPDFLAGKSDELIAISHPPIPNRQLWLVSHRDMKSHPYVTHVKQWIIETCRDILG
jgi:DNA-binding transcriptional LysR family regulator